MKSAKSFFVLIVSLYACVLIFDFLKANVLPSNQYPFIVRLQTLFLIVSGVIIIRFSVSKKAFHYFIILYAAIWLTYFLLKLVVFAMANIQNQTFESNAFIPFFLKTTQLLTPLPFIVFWLLNRVYLSNFKANEEAVVKN